MGRKSLKEKKIYRCKRCHCIIGSASKNYCINCLKEKFKIKTETKNYKKELIKKGF